MTILLAIIALVSVFTAYGSLSSRLSQLELKLKDKSEPVNPIIQPQNIPVATESVVYHPAVNDYAVKEPEVKKELKEESGNFTAWLKEDWLMKLGAALFIVGFGWFVSYAFINNWIGSVGRISLGIVAGVIIMALGFKRMMKYPAQGAVFMALGAGMTMLTIYAGQSIYNFFDPTSAIVFDFIIAVFVSFASYKFNVKTLAFTAQILAFATPLLAATHNSNSFFLFSYLFVVSLATIWLASASGWRELIVSSLIFVGFYSFPYFAGNTDAPLILNFAYLFSMMYLIVGMYAVIKQGVQSAQNEILLAALNGLFLFMWIYNVAPKDLRALIFAFWALLFAVGSFVIFKMSSKLAPFYAYGSVAVAFIAAATSAQLNGASLVIAFTLEAMLITIIVFLLTNNIKASITASWLFVVPALMSFSSMMAYSTSRDMFSKDFFVLVLLAFCLIVVGRMITSCEDKSIGNSKEVSIGSAFVIFGIIYLGYILWQFIHILISADGDMATMTTLIIYTIFGLGAYFAGLYGSDMARRTYGIVLLGFVVFRLVFVDVWNMQLFGRVVTFLVIGILLMSTAFITKNKKRELLEAQKLSA